MHNILRKIRIDNGITQKEMAQMLGVSRSCVANWESGIRKADLGIIREYNRLFGYKEDIENTFLRIKHEKYYSLDTTMLNEEGLDILLKTYKELINNTKYLKNT